MIENYDNKMIQSFEYETTAISDGNIIGTCELGNATIQMINDSNEYSSLKGQWIKTIHGSFYIHDVDPVQEKINIKLSCYDVKYKLDSKYDSSLYTWPMTLLEYRNAIGSNCGIEFADTSFPNSDLVLTKEPYIGDNPSNRDVMKIIAQAGCSWVDSDENDKFYFRWFEETTHQVDDWLELTTEKESSNPINVVVLGRGDVEDNVKWPETTTSNPVEFRIDNNYILDPQEEGSDQRYNVIEDIYNRVNGLSYLVFNMRTQNIQNKLSIILGQKVSYKDIWSNSLNAYIMTKKINYLGGDPTDDDNYEITLAAEEIKETSTELSYASSIENKLLQVERTTDKQNGIILDLVESQETIKQEFNFQKDASGSYIHLEDSSDNKLINLEIEGKSTQETRSGKNLLLNSQNFEQIAGFNAGYSEITSNKYNDCVIRNLDTSSQSSGEFSFAQWTDIRANNSIDFNANDIYTFSFWAKGTINNKNMRCYFYGNTGYAKAKVIASSNGYTHEYYNDGSWNFGDIITNEWKRFYVVWQIENASSDTIAIAKHILIRQYFGNNVDICGCMLEKGQTDGSNYEIYGASPSPDYPSEIKSVGYENLLDISKGENGTKNGMTISCENGIVTMNGTTTTITNFWFTNMNTLLSAGTYCFHSSLSLDDVGVYVLKDADGDLMKTKQDETFTIANDTTMTIALIQINSGVTFNNQEIQMQLEKGSIAHPYIPFGKYGIEFETGNGNLLKLPIRTLSLLGVDIKLSISSILLNGTSTSDGTLLADISIGIFKKGTYTFKNTINGGSYITNSKAMAIYLKNSKGEIIHVATNENNFESEKTFTLTENTELFLRNYINGAGIVFNNLNMLFQINNGTSTTKFEEYKHDTTLFVLNEPLRSLPNGVNDIAYIKNNKLYVEKKVGSVILDGSENWTFNNSSSPNFGFVKDDVGGTDKDDGTVNPLLCDKLTVASYGSSYLGHEANTISTLGGTVHKIYIRIDETINTIELLKTWLSENNTQLIYELSEPVIEELDEIEMPCTYKSVTNITTTDELEPTLNITYLTDTLLNAQYATKGELNITAESIKSELNKKVSDSELQEELININNTIEQKISDSESSITSSITSSYTEAISTAKTDAINSVNEATDNKLANYSTTTEMNNSITQKVTDATNEINIEVSKKVDNDEVISAINLSTEQIILKSNRVVIESDYFTLDSEGKIDATSGEIGGFVLGVDTFTADISTTYNFTPDDYNKIISYVNGETTLTDSELELYDINGDGVVDKLDALAVLRMYYEYIPNTVDGKLEINSKQSQRTIILRDSNGKIKTSLGLNGTVSPSISCDRLTLAGNQISDFSELNKYSSIEKLIGIWDDSKPLYRKVVSFETADNSNLSVNYYIDNVEEIWIDNSNSFITSDEETLPVNWYYGSSDWCRTWINKSTNQIRFRSPSSLGTRKVYCILNYTKTTDITE